MSIASRVCTQENEGKVNGTMKNLNNFQRDVLRRNVLEYYDNGNSLQSKITPILRERTAYKYLGNILIIYSYENVQ
jgi:hypothetical protein